MNIGLGRLLRRKDAMSETTQDPTAEPTPAPEPAAPAEPEPAAPAEDTDTEDDGEEE